MEAQAVNRPAGRMQPEELRLAARAVRLIALDLDGTAMNNRHEVTPHTRRVLRALTERGYLVVPATGRGFCNVKNDILPDVELAYGVFANGATVVDARAGKTLFEWLIPCQTAAAMVMDLLDDDENCLYVQYNDGMDTHRKACPSEEAFRRYYCPPWDKPQPRYTAEQLRDRVLEEGKGIPKLGLWFQKPGGHARYEALVARKYPGVNAYRVSENSLEFCHAATGKAVALRRLCEYLHIPAQQVCALGDNGNDVDMLAFAGLGVAMENAIPAARQAAACLAGPNDREGAARFLERLFL